MNGVRRGRAVIDHSGQIRRHSFGGADARVLVSRLAVPGHLRFHRE
jgi:hypothetical protein